MIRSLRDSSAIFDGSHDSPLICSVVGAGPPVAEGCHAATQTAETVQGAATMKTMNLFSLSLFVALAGLATSVGCSAPTVDDIDQRTTQPRPGDDDDDDDDDDKTRTTTKKKTPAKDERRRPDQHASGRRRKRRYGGASCRQRRACSACFAKNAKGRKSSTVRHRDCRTRRARTSAWGDQRLQRRSDLPVGGPGIRRSARWRGTAVTTTPPPGTMTMTTRQAATAAKCLVRRHGSRSQSTSSARTSARTRSATTECFEQACGANRQACDSKLDRCEPVLRSQP